MEEKAYHYGYYVIGFLDVLGQREKLRQLHHRLPRNDVEWAEAKKNLGETAGYVIKLRELLDDYYQQFKNPGPLLASLPVQVQKQIKDARHVARYRGFSDSFIMTASLRGDDDNCTGMSAAFGTIGACCMLPLVALSMKRPIRGGFDVGLGLEIATDEIYGPALERAHYLESRVADYPRVLVGDELWKYLNEVEAQPATTQFGKVAAKLASLSKGFITTDTDGHLMLDFLGQKVAKNLGPDQWRELHKNAGDYITEQEKAAQAEKDEKMISRYVKLRTYFESRSTPK
jgi:hypothetical protein